MSNGIMFVNGKETSQPYLDSANTTESFSRDFSFAVPEGHLFVLGDNRDHSNNSRFWGFLPVENVVGKVSMIWVSNDLYRVGKSVS